MSSFGKGLLGENHLVAYPRALVAGLIGLDQEHHVVREYVADILPRELHRLLGSRLQSRLKRTLVSVKERPR